MKITYVKQDHGIPVPGFLSKLKKYHFLILYLGAAIFKYTWVISHNQLNNFKIFRGSFYHFINGMPLYVHYPAEYYDLFLYSPAFPVFFSPFAIPEMNTGILLWLLFTALFCYFSFSRLPIDENKKKFFLLFIFFNLLNNLGHTQTTPVMLSLMLLFWVLREEKNYYFLRGLVLAVCFLLKGYGAIVALLLLFEKDRFKTILYAVASFLVVNCSLFLFVTPSQLFDQYKNWFLLIAGAEIKEHYSVYGLTERFLPGVSNDLFILIVAFLVLAVYLLFEFLARQKNAALLVAFLLIWVTVFNRGAEAATYIIAMAGVILWYLSRPPNRFSTILFYITIVTSTIFPTGLISFIDILKKNYYIVVFFCLIILSDMLILKIKELYHQQLLVKKINL